MPDDIPMDGNLSTIGPSLIRTVVPYLVGWLVTFLASKGIDVDESAKADLAMLATMVFGTAYYTIIRVIEKNHPKAGWLLGSPHAPVYPTNGGVGGAGGDGSSGL